MLFAVACGGSQGGDDKKNAKPVDASVTEVRNAFKNLAKVKAVRADISAQQIGANGQVGLSVFKYDFVPPDFIPFAGIGGGIGETASATRAIFTAGVKSNMVLSARANRGISTFMASSARTNSPGLRNM
jgi:hypothetical protein